MRGPKLLALLTVLAVLATLTYSIRCSGQLSKAAGSAPSEEARLARLSDAVRQAESSMSRTK